MATASTPPNHPADDETHVGLRIMRERAQGIGAQASVHSTAGQGHTHRHPHQDEQDDGEVGGEIHGALLLAALRVARTAHPRGDREHDLATALRAGASGYLLKTADSQELARAIVRATAGEATVSSALPYKLAAAFRATAPTPPADAAPPAAHDPLDRSGLRGGSTL